MARKPALALVETPVEEHHYLRQIKSVYYSDLRARNTVKTTRSLHANSACRNAFDHMQTNDYEAVLCEVYDERDGVLHAVLKRSMDGHKVETLFQRDVKKGM